MTETLRQLALDPKVPATARVSAARAVLQHIDGLALDDSKEAAQAALDALVQ